MFIKVGHREEAEDLTHQVFLRAWQNIGAYKNLGFPFSSWLYQIARNQVIDHYRTNKKETSLEQVDPEHFIVPATAEFALESRLELNRVHGAIQKLKADYQDILIMRYVEELSPKEIGMIMGKSEGAIKLIQHRAIKQLKELLH